MLSTTEVLKRLIEIGLPDKYLMPVLEAVSAPAAPKKRRKRRTKEEMARDAAKGRKKGKAGA